MSKYTKSHNVEKIYHISFILYYHFNRSANVEGNFRTMKTAFGTVKYVLHKYDDKNAFQ